MRAGAIGNRRPASVTERAELGTGISQLRTLKAADGDERVRIGSVRPSTIALGHAPCVIALAKTAPCCPICVQAASSALGCASAREIIAGDARTSSARINRIAGSLALLLAERRTGILHR